MTYDAEEAKREFDLWADQGKAMRAALEPAAAAGERHDFRYVAVASIAISLKRIADMLAVDALQRQHPLRRMDGGPP